MCVCVLTTHKLTTPLRKQSSTVRACVSCLHTIRLPIIFLLLRRPGGAIVMPVCVNHALQLHSKICVFYECVCVCLCASVMSKNKQQQNKSCKRIESAKRVDMCARRAADRTPGADAGWRLCVRVRACIRRQTAQPQR